MDHAVSSNAEVKNEWSYTSITPHKFLAFATVALTYLLPISCRIIWISSKRCDIPNFVNLRAVTCVDPKCFIKADGTNDRNGNLKAAHLLAN
jgi:hypothetical protein